MAQSTKELLIKKNKKNISLLNKVIFGLCPNCASTTIFKHYIKLLHVCPHCGYVINFQKIGDGAAWFTMLAVSIIVGIGVFILEINFQPKLWVHVIIWFPIIFILSFLILSPFKALILCISNYNNRYNNE